MRKKEQMSSKNIFQSFSEFWRFFRHLNDSQRKTLFESLSHSEREKLEKSYRNGGWGDLFMRNLLDSLIDKVKEDTGIDLIDMRIQVMNGKEFLMHQTMWVYIQDIFSDFKTEVLEYIFGGVYIEEHNDHYVKISRKD